MEKSQHDIQCKHPMLQVVKVSVRVGHHTRQELWPAGNLRILHLSREQTQGICEQKKKRCKDDKLHK